MATLFDEHASSNTGAFAQEARAAQRRFAERRDFLDARIRVYDSRMVLDRWRAFNLMWRAPQTPRVRLKSYIKDFGVGVSGFYAIQKSVAQVVRRE